MARCPISGPGYINNHPHYFTEFPTLHSLKRSKQLRFGSSLPFMFPRCKPTSLDTHSHSNLSQFPNICWDSLRFNPLPTDYIYVMRCSEGKEFMDCELQPYGKIQLNPFYSILNYSEVEERRVPVEELFDADEVFCTGNAIGVQPVNSITYSNKRICYRPGTVSRNIQMGLTEDKMGWTVLLNKD